MYIFRGCRSLPIVAKVSLATKD